MQERNLLQLKKLAAQFIQYLEAENFAARSREEYERELEFFIMYLDSETDMEQVTDIGADDLVAYQNYLYNYEIKEGKKLAAATQSKKLSVLKAFFSFLTRRHYVLSNAASELEMPKARSGLPRSVLTEGEVRALLLGPDTGSVLGCRDRALLETLYSSGLRISELRALDVYDLDLQEGTVRIRLGKGGQSRYVPLGRVACHAIEKYLQRARPKLMVAEKTTALFLSSRGLRLNKDTLNEMIKKYAQKAGIRKPVSAHTFRHTCATHLLKHGADIRYIQALLGHRRLSTTQVYTRVEISDLKRVHTRCHPRRKESA